MNEQCPRCESYRTQKLSKFGTFLTLIGTGSCSIWIGFLFPPMWILSALLIIASPLGFLVPKMTICKECNYSWKSGEAKEYKKAINEKEAAIKTATNNTIKTVESPILINESFNIKSEAEPKIEPVKKKPKPLKYITFRVAGVTKENEKGQDIQNIIKQVANAYKREGILESYSGYTNQEIIEGMYDMTEFEGQYVYDIIELVPEPDNPYDKNAIKVYIKDANEKNHHIGYVKKTDNVKLLHELKNNKLEKTSVEFIGGKIKRVDYDWEKDKDVVVVDEITRGVEITVYFENELKSS